MGFFYEKGYGTEKNFEKAFEYYTKAAMNGNKFAQFNLGKLYQYGSGVPKDEIKAFV